ncbi:MAG: periplasmic heavy metal sensor [Pseudomonadota bacterium]
MSDYTPSSAPVEIKPPSRGRNIAWIAVLVVVAGVTGAAAASAFGNGPGFGPGFPVRWHHGFGGPMDPAQIEDRADRMVRHAAIELDATNDQQEKLRAIVKSAVKDILPMSEKAQAARNKARELLTQDKVERSDIEKFRSEQAALADAFSKRIAQAIGDAAEVLSPEQRRKLADRLPPPGRGPGFGPGFGPGMHWN